MNTPAISEKASDRLKGKVTLIINGLNKSGRIMAQLLSQQGSDVAIVNPRPVPNLAKRICREVEASGCRCLVITPDGQKLYEASFSQETIETIVKTLGRLDKFIACPDTDSRHEQMSEDVTARQNGRSAINCLFEQPALTKAALKYIVTH